LKGNLYAGKILNLHINFFAYGSKEVTGSKKSDQMQMNLQLIPSSFDDNTRQNIF
jgi:hypothetical protein